MNNNRKRIDFSKWLRELFRENFRFYVTFSSKPIVSRPRLESTIAEFFNRFDKRILGRNYYKERLADRRSQGLVFFENIPHLHCHVVLRPASGNHRLSDDQIIDLCHKLWTGKALDGTSTARNVFNAMNPDGDIDVQVLHSPDDLYRENRAEVVPGIEEIRRSGVVWYSLKYADFKQKEYDDFLFLTELTNDVYPSLNELSKADYRRRRNFEHQSSDAALLAEPARFGPRNQYTARAERYRFS